MIIGLWLVLAAVPVYFGFDYYLLPLQDRPYDSEHELMKPSGLLGQGLGILGSLMIIIGVSTYIFRKRNKHVQSLGKLSSWLAFHIFLCTLGPFYVLLHTTFRFNGIVSISFWSMALVVASGIFGRYVYVRIPKTRNGIFLEARQLEKEKHQIIESIRSASVDGQTLQAVEDIVNTTAKERSKPLPLVKSLIYSTQQKRISRRFRKDLSASLSSIQLPASVEHSLTGLLLEYHRVSLQSELIRPFQRLFGYWHIFHLPLAIIMFLILFVHVGIAIAFGYTWIF